MDLTRRRLLQRSTAIALAFGGLRLSGEEAAADPAAGYGALVRDPAGVIDLPAGFSYRVLSRVGDAMSDGLIVPNAADGMAAFALDGGGVALVRNHELNHESAEHGAFGADFARVGRIAADRFYDFGSGRPPGGGTTTLVLGPDGAVRSQFLSLAGTHRNCAGGATPWGTWITCEETAVRAGGALVQRDHGYAFEVAAAATGPVLPTPLTAMGRFNREAIAVDAASGAIYQSEDHGDGLLYRFVPDAPGAPAKGGRLQALAVVDRDGVDTANWKSRDFAVGARHAVRWVDLDRPESPDDDLRHRGRRLGAATFCRGEGMWSEGGIWLCATAGGKARKGQVWRYRPSAAEGSAAESEAPGTLELFCEPDNGLALENCDNITVAPWGDLVLCEDQASKPEIDPGIRLVGVSPRGACYTLARNALNTSEFAGACFSPDGATLYVNIQSPATTLAITGPWRG
ncbi:MAG TPA: alkaline phosphatase PhoX [Planctomycetota bacterium]|nr:alkaline phosphatase PhoX [Planctomycetota bacterium]